MALIFDSDGETDFSENWYAITGRGLLMNMVLGPVGGTAGPIVNMGLDFFKRWHDRGYSQDKYRTKCTTRKDYIDLYSGPDIPVADLSAEILMVIGVALFYGSAMPLMYPLCAFNLAVIYVRETLLIYYFYKKPPMLDGRATKSTLYTVCFVAFASLPFVFWQLGNRQIFDNKLFDIDK
jgi:hypothetical protein